MSIARGRAIRRTGKPARKCDHEWVEREILLLSNKRRPGARAWALEHCARCGGNRTVCRPLASARAIRER